jgi:isopenicillin N synthase-like dioxygenase
MSSDDRSWLAFFVRPNTSAAVRILTEEEKAAVKAQQQEDRLQQALKWEALDEIERARQVSSFLSLDACQLTD